jgi:checkpoint serine/threonine-protein kinase
LTDEDDPLAAYHQFVQWTIKNYGENNPKSGLKDLLMEATSQFKDDQLYKTDLRYLKLWALYARQMDKAGALAIYASLDALGIGTSYSALYEDYANLLEGDGRYVTSSL